MFHALKDSPAIDTGMSEVIEQIVSTANFLIIYRRIFVMLYSVIDISSWQRIIDIDKHVLFSFNNFCVSADVHTIY